MITIVFVLGVALAALLFFPVSPPADCIDYADYLQCIGTVTPPGSAKEHRNVSAQRMAALCGEAS